MLETYLNLLDLGHFEATFAFDGLADENVWRRPAEQILSVGELAGHIAHWEAVRLAGEGGDPWPDLSKCKVSSPLIDRRFAYYTSNLAIPPSPRHLAMTADQVSKELARVHNEAAAYIRQLNPDLQSGSPGWPAHFNYGESLKYAIFHVSYHVGQMYTVRHLLGELTPDN